MAARQWRNLFALELLFIGDTSATADKRCYNIPCSEKE
jgi:hypothetical protein